MHYLVDLVASALLVLAFGWIFQASASDLYLRDALITQNEIYVAISRFTPRNLFFSYVSALDHITRYAVVGFSGFEGFTAAVGQALAAVLNLILDIGFAVPRTLVGLYEETSGTAAWIVLTGFGMAIASVIAWLLAARVSAWRLLLAAAVTPVAISVVFLILQAFMALMLDAFFWFTVLAPYTVACPLICSLYWIVFPHADRGATATAARAIVQVLEPSR